MPVIDAEEEALRELGRKADMNEGREDDSSEGAQKPEATAPPAETETPQVPDKPKPDDSEPEPELPPPSEERKRDEKGRFKGQEPEEHANGDAPPLPEKPKSQYAQARDREAKDRERQDRSWSRLQQEKDTFRAEQAKWEEERRREQLQTQVQPRPLVKDGLSIQQYHQAYQDFRKAGDHENAMRSLETVLELEAMGRQEQERTQYAQYELAWRTDMDTAIGQHSDLTDPESALYQEVDRIVKQEPYLFYVPGGFHKAVELATILLAAGSDSELREENEKLRAQLEEYQRSSQPARGGLGRPPQGPKRQEDMTPEEEEIFIRDLTAQADRY